MLTFFKKPLVSILQEQPEELEALLKSLTEYDNILDMQILQQIFYDEIRSSWLAFIFQYDHSTGLDLLKLLNKYPALIDKKALQELFLMQAYNNQNALQYFTNYNPERLEVLLLFIDEYSQLFEKETIKQLFFRKEGCHIFSGLQSSASQPEGFKRLLTFFSTHPDLIDKQDWQEMLLQTTINGNLLQLTAAYPESLSALLNFLTIPQIIC